MWSHCKVLPMTYVEKSEISFIINKLYHLDIAAMISNCLLYTTGQAARLVEGEREKEKPQTAEDNKGKGQLLRTNFAQNRPECGRDSNRLGDHALRLAREEDY